MTDAGPVRWWVSLDGVDPRRTRVEALHAMVCGWLDDDQTHRSGLKPFSLTPLATVDAEVGFEVSTLTPVAAERLQAGAQPGAALRLGDAVGTVARAPVAIARDSWASLAEPSGTCRWTLCFETPMTTRSGQRSSPLPLPASMLQRLGGVWSEFSGHDPRSLAPGDGKSLWVSALAGDTVRTRLAMGVRKREASGRVRPSPVTISGFVGTVEVRCDDQALADRVDALFRLAGYAGTGSYTEKGLGVTRLLDSCPGRAG